MRHLKTLGPLPILWDRWQLASPRTPRLLLAELLAAAGAGIELMLDLKGRDDRLARRVVESLVRAERDGRITVCSQNWRLLEALRGVPSVRLVHSVGNKRQLRALRRRFCGVRLDGISIHRELLDAAEVRDLRERAQVVMSWPVETPAEARRLAAWGVHGLISKDFERIAEAIA